jgi:hypothetical protein
MLQQSSARWGRKLRRWQLRSGVSWTWLWYDKSCWSTWRALWGICATADNWRWLVKAYRSGNRAEPQCLCCPQSEQHAGLNTQSWLTSTRKKRSKVQIQLSYKRKIKLGSDISKTRSRRSQLQLVLIAFSTNNPAVIRRQRCLCWCYGIQAGGKARGQRLKGLLWTEWGIFCFCFFVGLRLELRAWQLQSKYNYKAGALLYEPKLQEAALEREVWAPMANSLTSVLVTDWKLSSAPTPQRLAGSKPIHAPVTGLLTRPNCGLWSSPLWPGSSPTPPLSQKKEKPRISTLLLELAKENFNTKYWTGDWLKYTLSTSLAPEAVHFQYIDMEELWIISCSTQHRRVWLFTGSQLEFFFFF